MPCNPSTKINRTAVIRDGVSTSFRHRVHGSTLSKASSPNSLEDASSTAFPNLSRNSGRQSAASSSDTTTQRQSPSHGSQTRIASRQPENAGSECRGQSTSARRNSERVLKRPAPRCVHPRRLRLACAQAPCCARHMAMTVFDASAPVGACADASSSNRARESSVTAVHKADSEGATGTGFRRGTAPPIASFATPR